MLTEGYTAKGGVKKRLGRKKKKGGPGSPGDEEGGVLFSLLVDQSSPLLH